MQIRWGWIHCNIQSNSSGLDNNGTVGHYVDQQLHKWSWTNSPPLIIPSSIPTDDNITSATVSVSGGGSVTETDNSGSVTSQATWTTGGTVGVTLRVWQGSNGVINLTSPGPDVPNGYSVRQNNGPPQTFPVHQPPIPQTLLSGPGSSAGHPAFRGSWLIYGPPFALDFVNGKFVVSNEPSLFGTMQQTTTAPIPGGASGWVPPNYVTSTLTWTWRLLV